LKDELQKNTTIDPNSKRNQFAATNKPLSFGKICCNNVIHRRDKEGMNGNRRN
jgi:hypothetical protein